jgi:hypothetical protein
MLRVVHTDCTVLGCMLRTVHTDSYTFLTYYDCISIKSSLLPSPLPMSSYQEVTEEDAEDVVQLLHESLLDAFTTDTGEVDFGRKGGISLAKQVE